MSNFPLVFCTVNAGTNTFTNITISSILQFHPDAKIFIIDALPHIPFIPTNESMQDNIEVIPGISFEEFIPTLPEIDIHSSNLSQDNQEQLISKLGCNGTFKTLPTSSLHHSANIQFAIDTLQQNFILMDSDAPLIHPIDFIDDKSICIGEVEEWMPLQKYVIFKHMINRIAPWLHYINVNELRRQGIQYFTNELMKTYLSHASLVNPLVCDNNEPVTLQYITGSLIHHQLQDKGIDFLKINTSMYIEHFTGGTWNKNVNMDRKRDFYMRYMAKYPWIRSVMIKQQRQ